MFSTSSGSVMCSSTSPSSSSLGSSPKQHTQQNAGQEKVSTKSVVHPSFRIDDILVKRDSACGNVRDNRSSSQTDSNALQNNFIYQKTFKTNQSQFFYSSKKKRRTKSTYFLFNYLSYWL